MPQVSYVFASRPGYYAVLVKPGAVEPVFHDIVAWAVLEQQETHRGSDGNVEEVVTQGVIPMIVCPDRRCRTLELATHIEGYLGIALPQDTPAEWADKAQEWKTMREARQGVAETALPRGQRWN